MYHRYTACRSILRQQCPIEHVWISESTLTEAFRRFSAPLRHSARHGSNVPGPLEAQRRLTKRKLAGLSSASSYPTPDLDLSFLLGLGRQQQGTFQWEAPRPTGPITDPLERDSITSPLTSALEQSLVPEELDVSHNDATEADRFATFSTQLRSIKSVDELREIWTQLVRDGDNQVQFSREAFHTLRRRKIFRFGAIMTFLQDKRLNVSNAENLGGYFSDMARCAPKYSVKMCNWNMFFDVIQEKITQGALTKRELGLIIKNLESLTWRSWKNAGNFGEQTALLRAYEAVWNGMTVHKTNPSIDYGRDMLQRLALKIMVLSPDVRVNQYSKHAAAKQKVRQIFAFKKRISQEIQLHSIDIIDELCRGEHRGFKTVCRDLLARCPQYHAEDWIMSMTKSLVQFRLVPRLTVSSHLTLLNKWLECLHQSSMLKSKSIEDDHLWNSIHTLLAYHLPPSRLLDHFKSLEGENICRILLKNWYPRHFVSSSDEDKQHILKKVVAEYNHWSAGWIDVAPGAPLLARPFVILIYLWLLRGPSAKNPIKSTIHLVHKLYGAEVVCALILGIKYNQNIKGHRFLRSIPADCVMQAVSELLELDPPKALQLLRSTARNPGLVPKVTLGLVTKANIGPIDARHVMLVNKSMPPAEVSLTPVLKKYLTLPRLLTHHNKAVLSRDDLYEAIALEYAFNHRRPPRAAYRRAVFVYYQMRSRRIAIRKGTTTALVHSGIIRPLQTLQVPSPQRIKWILKVVREVEGEAVAEAVDRLSFQWGSAIIRDMRARLHLKRATDQLKHSFVG